jgi:hyperosmotically inducible periplasmic protein
MARCWAASLAFSVLLVASCSQRDEERARQRAAEARQKAREGAHQLAHEVRRAADALNHDVNQAVTGTGARADGDQARQKLRVASGEAGAKLDEAALLAKVKAKLANDAGLSTVTGVDVDVNGDVVTLRGTVSSPEQKQMAERAAGQVAGVSRVVDDLQVKP